MTRRASAGHSLFGYSLGYAPLEQMEGEPTDERSDLYALGATLYALLAGRRPDDPISRQRYIDRGYPDPLQPANEVNAQVPSHVARALQQATAIARVQRPASAVQMRAMLNPPRPQPVAPPVSRVRVSSTQQAPRVAQTTSYSQPISSPAAPVSSVDTANGGNNKQMLLWGAMIAAVLLVGVLVWVYGMGDDGSETAKDGMGQVYVPAGEFEMGSANDDFDAADDEKPRHAVYLEAFWIDQTEVTNAMYGQCVAAGRCAPPSSNGSRTQDSYYGNASFDNYPVLYVSWDNANAYCAWAGRRLPTEAEWEKAAGGILTTEGSRKYPWGNDAPNDTLANFDFNVGDTSPVGNYPAGASPYGALDMAGNVWEWVSDSYDSNYYVYSPRENPTGPSPYRAKVLRGGSWSKPAPIIRVRNRLAADANVSISDVGFRCARSER